MSRALAALVRLTLCSSCAKGTEQIFPKTRRGWGIVTMVVGAAWVVVGVAAAASSDNSAGERVGYGAAGLGLGALLLTGGYYLADFGDNPKPAQPSQSAPARAGRLLHQAER